MDLEAVDLFLDVARRGGFAAAARARGIDPSSVSRTISGLETALGVRLFQRTTRRLRLTEAGSLYAAKTAPLLEELRRANAAARNAAAEPEGLLRLTASATFGQRIISPLIRDFRALYPRVGLDCLYTDANLDLVGEGIDLAVRLAPSIEADLVAAKLFDTRYRVVASPDYLRSSPPLAGPQDLSGRRCLLFSMRAFRTTWRFRKGPKGRVVEVAVAGDVTLSPAGALREAAMDGLGPALLPDWLVADDLAAGRLVDCFPDHEAAAASFETAAWVVYPSRAFLPQKVRVMIDFLRLKLGPASARRQESGTNAVMQRDRKKT